MPRAEARATSVLNLGSVLPRSSCDHVPTVTPASCAAASWVMPASSRAARIAAARAAFRSGVGTNRDPAKHKRSSPSSIAMVE